MYTIFTDLANVHSYTVNLGADVHAPHHSELVWIQKSDV